MLQFTNQRHCFLSVLCKFCIVNTNIFNTHLRTLKTIQSEGNGSQTGLTYEVDTQADLRHMSHGS